ncbi:MAG: YggS family pyridoxal phosphate-dependent enzyme [Bacteroidetes bacterium]|nr:YggS family pyridoxal phosphate-dependent enzyme [Bacteroidota bacterium]MBR3090677.1 YggS family pyridoxal phosphate-dependent enzyme [Bacteroidota bacterium]
MQKLIDLKNTDKAKELLEKINIVLDKINTTAKRCGRNPNDIKLLAVSKTQAYDVLLKALSVGINVFAENYAQEFRDKNKQIMEFLNLTESDIKEYNDIVEFHFIGHLQANKVKYLIPYVSTIHTVDSIELANEINKHAKKYDRKINVLLQINTSKEESKSGIEPDQAEKLASQILTLEQLNLVGLMTIGRFSLDEIEVRKDFSLLRNTLEKLNKNLGLSLKELSMGMSHDYDIAIEEQATMVRVGTSIFGERIYHK